MHTRRIFTCFFSFIGIATLLSTSTSYGLTKNSYQKRLVNATAFNTNLVVNGDAESGIGSTGSSKVNVPNWTTSGGFTAIQYSASSGFPNYSTPGPPNRGLNFFAGGQSDTSNAYQEIDISDLASSIDQGNTFFTTSGYLGGYGADADRTTLVIFFFNDTGSILNTTTVGPVTDMERQYRTSLLYKSVSGTVPSGTRKVRIQLQMTLAGGFSNDGYADDISFVLSQTKPVATYLPIVKR